MKSQLLIFLYSNISIVKLHSNHTGKYECKLNSSSGTRIQTISLTIISNKTRFCGVEGKLCHLIIHSYFLFYITVA